MCIGCRSRCVSFPSTWMNRMSTVAWWLSSTVFQAYSGTVHVELGCVAGWTQYVEADIGILLQSLSPMTNRPSSVRTEHIDLMSASSCLDVGEWRIELPQHKTTSNFDLNTDDSVCQLETTSSAATPRRPSLRRPASIIDSLMSEPTTENPSLNKPATSEAVPQAQSSTDVLPG